MKQVGINNIRPDKITKPIQLLSTWLIGLVVIDFIFLNFAVKLISYNYLTAFLVVASIINVPIFMWSLFTLQTKYRPEMQEDGYYYDYLKEGKFGKSPIKQNPEAEKSEHKLESLEEKLAELTKLVENNQESKEHKISELEIIKDSIINSMLLSSYRFSLNNYLTNFEEISEALLQNGIVVDEYFGNSKGEIPDYIQLVIGHGFSNKSLKKILESFVNFPTAMICYNDGEEEHGQYNNKMLIGAYGGKAGLLVSTVINLLNEGIANNLLYYEICENK